MTVEESSKPTSSPPIVGRTFWDIAIGGSYIMGGVLVLCAIALILYLWLDEIPPWFWISIGGSFFFIPFLMERAKEDTDLFLVSDSPFKLTEWRVGRKFGLDIEGNGSLFMSDSGTYRTVLTSLDPELRYGTGSSFGEYSQIDQVRDMNTLMNLSTLLEETLRENRISHQTVGVEVERKSKEIVDWALQTIYGAIVPTEISDIFGSEEKDVHIEHETLEEIIKEVEE